MNKQELDNRLLENIKTNIVELENLLREISEKWCYEDMIYRFYHHSFKVYHVQELTKEIVDALKSLAPVQPAAVNEWFLKILEEGASGRKWELNMEKHLMMRLLCFRPDGLPCCISITKDE